jgi:hypothetical protein
MKKFLREVFYLDKVQVILLLTSLALIALLYLLEAIQ